ncbi:monovalent cation:proton antiporter-2 (CPA2) family protein [Bdellovibrio reynosensis]|uniref:Monovalent cation:proton antiporter-2 (CPA2) family protein n=1 Tax=Bdellovibrio reynosensis TaxID=2835041 RepID=A0ABY4CBM5_9BACT|nr:monovalent cation:proton antiporter-2 (CPA2) family protein [Bdellovibrio reynosensis]UOF02378.1 monovalent cation:proton antiporter-2 (CPA2) family protein [Bdellovibrio reynosensis]
MNESYLFTGTVILLTALVCVPICKRLGFGSVLGYLLAGLILGPFGLKIITRVEDLMHLSEFGVVFLMFIIGLELEPRKLWDLRTSIFALGGMQVLLGGLLLAFVASLYFGSNIGAAIIVGMSFVLSSTAMGLQILAERGQMNTSGGRSAFSILLFQDIAVIVMIALLPLLAKTSVDTSSKNNFLEFSKIVLILSALVVGGRFLLRPVLRWIATQHLRDIFTAFALFLVIGMSYVMHELGVSMALGAFIAGVLLADSEYRHALEADIEPFKGLLMGLFFISVGTSVNITRVLNEPGLFVGAAVLVYILKSLLHVGLGFLFKIPRNQILFFALLLSQVGEFAFVLVGTALALRILEPSTSEFLVGVVALSLLMTPIVMLLYDKLVLPFMDRKPKQVPDKIESEEHSVIIAGFGRFGQIIGRLLYANGVSATVLDHEPGQIEMLRKFGFKVYYGDATRIDLLIAAGAEKASILIVAIDNVEDSLRLVEEARRAFPHLQIFARARNLAHMHSLMELKVDVIERETFESSLRMGSQVLRKLGWPAYQSVVAANIFRDHNIKMVEDLFSTRGNQDETISRAKQARADLEQMLQKENEYLERSEEAWDFEHY